LLGRAAFQLAVDEILDGSLPDDLGATGFGVIVAGPGSR
jgi:hypothetical protein